MDGDTRLFNPYGVIVVNPKRHPHVKAELGQAFIDWLIGAEGQAAIGAFRINGEVLFKANAMAGVGKQARILIAIPFMSTHPSRTARETPPPRLAAQSPQAAGRLTPVLGPAPPARPCRGPPSPDR